MPFNQFTFTRINSRPVVVPTHTQFDRPDDVVADTGLPTDQPTTTTPNNVPNWVWIVLAAIVVFLVFKK